MLGKVMEKTQIITKNGAEKGAKIRKNPYKIDKTTRCENRSNKKMRSRESPGEPFVPRTPTFKDLLRSRVHEGKQKEETQPTGEAQRNALMHASGAHRARSGYIGPKAPPGHVS